MVKQFILTYLSLVLFGTLCFAQSIKSNTKTTSNKKVSFSVSKFSQDYVKPNNTSYKYSPITSGVEFGISKRINSESKKNRLSVGTDFGSSFQFAGTTNVYIKPNISYNINLWKNFYFKPRVSLGASIYKNNLQIDCPVGVPEELYKIQGKTFTNLISSVGVEPSYTFLKTKNYNFNFFTRFELQQTPLTKLMPVTMWQIGLNIIPAENTK